jgi:hypothetical protein
MSEPARDPIGDFQRWLMKAGARSLSREVADKVKATLGGSGRAKHASVWETATSEPPGDEPPECQWCPICRAARRYRDSGGTGSPDISTQMAGVGDVLAGFTKDAFSLFEAAVRTAQRPPGAPAAPKAPPAAGTPAATAPAAAPPTGTAPTAAAPQSADTPSTPSTPSASSTSSDDRPVVGSGVTWAAAVVHAEDEDSEPADEGGHREEDGEPGDTAADSGGDEQVEGSAE